MEENEIWVGGGAQFKEEKDFPAEAKKKRVKLLLNLPLRKRKTTSEAFFKSNRLKLFVAG